MTIRRLLFLLLPILAACEEVIEPTAPPLPVAAVSAAANADRAVLVALYEAMDGPNWKDNTNWLTDAPLGEWYGVSVNADGRVVGLELGGYLDWESGYRILHGLSGSIPPELGNLSALATLNLHYNALSGPIPPELGKLSALEKLQLFGNALSGSIPPELGNLSELRSLYLYSNNLSGSIPSELGNLSALEGLDLSWNDLSGSIPSELGNLSALATLNLHYNALSGPIPPELGKLSALQSLYLSSNALSGSIPPELGNLSELQGLYLSSNALSGSIPPELGNLSELQGLYLSSNALSGSIPPELGNLSELQGLYLSSNALSGSIPPELGKLSALQSLYLSSNALSGSIPPELGNLSELRRLYLSSNALSGSIPPELGKLSALQSLYLSNNALSGSIPPELGKLSALQSLYLSNNDLSGPLPESFLNLSARLEMYNTDLCVPGTDAFDQWWRQVQKSPVPLCGYADRAVLEKMYKTMDGTQWSRSDGWLSDVASSGWYGITTDSLEQVVGIELPANNLKGHFPWFIADLSKLKVLDISDNPGIQGRLPWALTKASLEVFRFAGTGLCNPEELQDWLAAIPVVEGTDGVCPHRAALTALYEATDGSNWTINANWMTDAPLGEWYGVSVNEWGRVVGLDLYSNNLSGSIPPELGNLSELRRFWLNSNNLSGSIPLELGNMSELQSLYLSGNDLSGPIPELFLELGALTHLKISNTDLCVPQTDAFDRWRTQLSSPVPLCVDDREVLEEMYKAMDGTQWTRFDGWLGDVALSEWHGITTNSLEQVVSIELPANNLKGHFPRSITDLTELKVLDISHNPSLQGRLPLKLNGHELEVLRFAGTRLCSPEELREWIAAIPVAEGTSENCPPLTDREILVALYETTGGPNWKDNTNWLTDAPLGEWSDVSVNAEGRVVALYLSDNDLTGPLPPELGNLSALQSLYLSDNDLSGPIPSELGNLSALQSLYLSDNDLSGPIPPELGNLSALQSLYLSDNDLSGPIPPELGNLSALQSLYLSDNDLSGPIPPELGNLSALQSLYLSDNDLSGPIPSELGNLSALQSLYLSDNDLSGPIPPELGQLFWLRTLGLSHNEDLSGALPMTLAQLRLLPELILSNTGLCASTDPAFIRWTKTLLRYRVRSCSATTSMAYLVQASQSLKYPVPLIAGREALLRVFPTAPAGNSVPIPPVRASFYASGSATASHTVKIPGKPGPLPTEIYESDLGISANVRIPGELLQPGLEMVIEIDPDGTLDPALGIASRLPAEGRTALEVEALPTMELTLIPFLWTENPDLSLVTTVNAMAADPYGHHLLRFPQAILPAHEWSVAVHEPVWTDIRPDFANSSAILGQTSVIRFTEGGSGYWMGTLEGGGGMAYVGKWLSVSSLDPWTIAHELGHNLSLMHAPCGLPAGVDPGFPYWGGQSGAWGYDFTNDTLTVPDQPEVMSYCGGEKWISDYHFTNALRHRRRAEPPPSSPTSALLLWGGVDSTGTPHLEPAFVVDAPPTLPETGGPWTIEGTTATGQTLFTLPFAMPEIADGGGGEGGFVYALPTRPGWEALASITLSGPDNATATLDGSTDLPMSIYRDQTGRVRAILRGDPMQADAMPGSLAGLALDIMTSRGIPAVATYRRP